MIIRRFISCEYVHAENGLDDIKNRWEDLTVRFTEFGTGWKTTIYSNNSDTYLLLDDLSPEATKWYLEQIKELTFKKFAKSAITAK